MNESRANAGDTIYVTVFIVIVPVGGACLDAGMS